MGPIDWLELGTSFKVIRDAVAVALVALWFVGRQQLLAVFHWAIVTQAAGILDEMHRMMSGLPGVPGHH